MEFEYRRRVCDFEREKAVVEMYAYVDKPFPAPLIALNERFSLNRYVIKFKDVFC
jgi:hypothetical protein